MRSGSAAESAFVQEGLFFRRGLAAQRRIAVRIAAIADDDVPVDASPFLGFGVSGRQGHVAILIFQRLGMLERQQDEVAKREVERLVMSAPDRLVREHQGQRVGGEGVACAAKAVPRELVQQDEQGQGALGRLDPVVQFAPGGGNMGVMEAAAELGVEGVVLGEPFLGTGFFPEGDDGGRGYVCAHD